MSNTFLDFMDKKNINNTKNKKNTLSKEDFIYSNELVKDIKLLKNSNSLESLDNFIHNRMNDLSNINSMINKTERDMVIKRNLLAIEAIDYENYYQKGMNFFSLLLKWLEILWKKFLAFLLGIIKKIKMMWFGLVRKKLSQIEKEFDPEKFIHLDKTVTDLKSFTTQLEIYLGIMNPEHGKYGFLTFKDDHHQVLKNLTTPISELMDIYLRESKDNLPTLKEVVDDKDYDFTEIYNKDSNATEMFLVKLARFAPDQKEKEAVVQVGLRAYFADLFFRSPEKEDQTDSIWTVRRYLKAEEKKRPILLDALKDYKNDSDDMKLLEKVVKKMKKEYIDFRSIITKTKDSIKDPTKTEERDTIKSLRNLVCWKVEFLTIMSKELESFYVVKSRILASIGKTVLVGQGYNKDSEVEFG